MIRRPPRSTRTYTLFPYTTLFRSIQNKPVIVQNISLTKIDSNDEISFKEKFLTANPNKYTVNLAYTRSAKRAESMIKRNNISDDAFFFSFGVEGISQKIMYGVFDTKEEAFNAIKSLPKELKSNKPRPEKVYIKQDLYKKYHGVFTPTKTIRTEQIVVAKKIVESKPKLVRNVSFSNVEKEFVKPTNFKEKFLTANPNMYTVNLAYTRSAKGAASMIKRNKITDDAFYFSFGVEGISQKIMYGVFETKEEALKAIESLPKELKSNKPRVEKVNIKQNLYKKYHGDSFKTANTRENLV